jgi:TolB-like protein
VPVISTHTQERSKGYFRLEWKLAVDQTHLLAEGVPFIAPVVIDDTKESSAIVPPEFMRVQWSRLPGALPTPQFVGQVKRLLEGKPVEPGRPRPGTLTRGEVAAPSKKSIPGWTWGAITAVVVGIGVALSVSRKSEPAAAAAVVAPPPASVLAARPEPAERAPSTPAAADTKSIAVLPFANFSADKDNAFFADGMHDEVITALAKIHDLTVISRTSVMAYKNPEGRNLKKIAAELGVASILEGSVQRAGNRVKVIVQLIDARRDQHLWAETYTEDVTDVFTIQAKLAGAITTALKATLSPEEKSLIARRPTENQEAYDLYLRALALKETLTGSGDNSRESLDRVAALYEQAIARDPDFTLAYVQLGATHGQQYWFGNLDPTPARRARAKAARDAALRLSPDSPETRLALGTYAYTCENDWAGALVEFRAALAGLPNDAQVLYYIGLAQRRLGRLPEALDSFARSIELNPRDALIPVQQLQTLHGLRRFQEEHDLALRYVKLFPKHAQISFNLALVRFELDHDPAAYSRNLELIPALSIDPHGLLKAYRIALTRGDLMAADRALADPRLTTVPGVSSVINEPVALHRAQVASLLGQREEARAFADETVAYFGSRQWVPRQEPWVMSAVALAQALAGRSDEAARLARESVAVEASRDAFDVVAQRLQLAQVYLILDRRDEALSELKELMKGPCGLGPEQLRITPFWSRLKGDPRFEEILKSAKPL